MSGEMKIVARTIKDAFASKTNAEQCLADPAAAFRRNGLSLPKGDDEGFNSYFKEVAGDLVARLREASEDQLSAAHREVLTGGAGCTWCKVGAYTVAAAIVIVGVAGLAALTPESGVVVALADFAGVDVEAALTFLRGLGAVISQGTGAVANEICQWMGACS